MVEVWRGRATAVKTTGPPYGADLLTAFGVTSLVFMMLMYALDRRHRHVTIAFALGCPR